MKFFVFFAVCVSTIALGQPVTTLNEFRGNHQRKTGELFTVSDIWLPPDMGQHVGKASAYVENRSNQRLPAIGVRSEFKTIKDKELNKWGIDCMASCRFDSAGTYRFVREVSYTGLSGTKFVVKQYWILDVSAPVLEPKLDSVYYPYEKGYFNFASGHSDYDKYSWTIYDPANPGRRSFSGTGPVVPLDSLTRWDSVLVEFEPRHQYVIKGMYDGQSFRYAKTGAGNALSGQSLWTITINKPVLQELNTWPLEDDFNKAAPAERAANSLKLHSYLFANLCEFRYAYFSRKGNSYIYTPMLISGIEVESSSRILSNTCTETQEGFYHLIQIRRKDDKAPPLGKSTDVTLRISFYTQYEQVERRCKAIVLY
ncbi:MAG TPA: hypothetical protein VK470_02120 [Bacteroidota bacterium]|nr:hypothetical protein [Bacteroidota bacterium]